MAKKAIQVVLILLAAAGLLFGCVQAATASNSGNYRHDRARGNDHYSGRAYNSRNASYHENYNYSDRNYGNYDYYYDACQGQPNCGVTRPVYSNYPYTSGRIYACSSGYNCNYDYGNYSYNYNYNLPCAGNYGCAYGGYRNCLSAPAATYYSGYGYAYYPGTGCGCASGYRMDYYTANCVRAY